MTTTFLNLWLAVGKGMPLLNTLLQQSLFFMSVKCHGDHKTVTKIR